ncbi:MAG: tRNA lysidine(34) synthetase TilS [Clostridiales bacterium]|nr:tRNA lysidine(34) synthetase TilS [Clostridiales bacterium]
MDLKKFSGKKICVAVSGGADSVALLHYLKSHESECGFSLSAVHCEHGIRGEESLADMAFVQELCKKLEVELAVFAQDCPSRAEREKVSLETAARNFRREVFARIIAEKKADFIATAHHQNDEAETVLFRIARGAALTGASGMKEEDGWMIRPLLAWKKAEIVAYITAHGLDFCTDSTNEDVAFTRNRLRKEVLPALENAVDGAVENIARFAVKAAEDDELLYEYARGLLRVSDDEDGRAYTVAFCDKKPLFYRACLLAIKGLGIERDYTTAHLDGAYALQSSERGAKCDLPKGVEAVKNELGIVFHVKTLTKKVEKSAPKRFSMDGFDGGRYEVTLSNEPVEEVGGWRVLRADADKIPPSAVFRFRQEGDVIARFGGGTKTLKKFFNEEKTPTHEREYLPLIAEPSGDVYAVCGVEISEKIKVDDKTKNRVYIQIKRKD